VRAGHRVGAQHDLQCQLARALVDVGHQRQTLFHVREAFLVVIADAQKFRLVIQVIVQHQEIRVEVNPVVLHQLQRLVVQERPVFDGSAARQNRGPRAIRRMRVHDGRKPCALASPQAALIWSTVAVILPPSRMLAVANSFTRSAPSALYWSTRLRICSGVPEFSVIWCSDVRMRGPGMAPVGDHVAQVAVLARPGTVWW
jgi:hypothetical protein